MPGSLTPGELSSPLETSTPVAPDAARACLTFQGPMPPATRNGVPAAASRARSQGNGVPVPPNLPGGPGVEQQQVRAPARGGHRGAQTVEVCAGVRYGDGLDDEDLGRAPAQRGAHGFGPWLRPVQLHGVEPRLVYHGRDRLRGTHRRRRRRPGGRP